MEYVWHFFKGFTKHLVKPRPEPSVNKMVKYLNVIQHDSCILNTMCVCVSVCLCVCLFLEQMGSDNPLPDNIIRHIDMS